MTPTKTSLARIAGDRVHAGLIASVLALLVLGSVMVWSATVTMTAHSALVQRQLIGIAVGTSTLR